MLIKDKDFNKKMVEQIAEEMCVAARTAPKAKGWDLLDMAIAKDDTIQKISTEMLKIGKEHDHKTFLRDGENILNASAIVIIGTKKKTLGLKFCSLCGFPDCMANDKAGSVCALNTGDLGIAIGSAVSVAMDHRLDNRIMYTVGKAAISLGLLDKDVVIAHGIPLSATGKNPFFDRK